ncbi:MAG: hypothetical protein H6624_06290 [Bdellovibrionaceae bacterium]|nr:hypothetical protein [Bdellovibrionales bacterium]MCB9083933.1 hypothetical protein [Pseudobdellovibrionaceae bacterium]
MINVLRGAVGLALLLGFLGLALKSRAATPEKSKGMDSISIINATANPTPSGCETLKVRIESYNDLARQNEDNIAGYLAELAQVMRVWHGELSPLEGHNVFIEKGSFDPIRNTGDNVAASVQAVRRNSEELSLLVKEILTELPGCLK